jgi:hypothetical protein
VQQWLLVVEVGDNDANSHGHQRHESVGKGFFSFDAHNDTFKDVVSR